MLRNLSSTGSLMVNQFVLFHIICARHDDDDDDDDDDEDDA